MQLPPTLPKTRQLFCGSFLYFLYNPRGAGAIIATLVVTYLKLSSQIPAKVFPTLRLFHSVPLTPQHHSADTLLTGV